MILRKWRRGMRPPSTAESWVDFGIGTGILTAVIALRSFGVLQTLELSALDSLQRLSVPEAPDSHITILGIDDDMFSSETDEGGLIESQALTRLIESVMKHQPAVVGVNIIKDDIDLSNSRSLQALFDKHENLITIEKALLPTIAPLDDLSTKVLTGNQIGFDDVSLDQDYGLRRMFLGVELPLDETQAPNGFKKSFSLLLSERYLSEFHQIQITNGRKDPDAMMFQQVEIPWLKHGQGSYQNEPEIYPVQTLINFRAGSAPFRILPISNVRAPLFSANDIKDKIVVIGIIGGEKVKRFEDAAINSQLPPPLINGTDGVPVDGLTGIELQAHAISQIVSAVLYGRPLLWFPSAAVESTLLLFVTASGMAIGRRLGGAAMFLTIGSGTVLIILCSYVALSQTGLYLPLVPASILLCLTGVVVSVLCSERVLKQTIKDRNKALDLGKRERQNTIEQYFEAIHNGPLQTLAATHRKAQDTPVSTQEICENLERLNQEIRDIGDGLRRDAIRGKQSFRISSTSVELSLECPLHEIFNEIVSATLKRDLAGFKSLKVISRDFRPLPNCSLSFEQQRKLGRFLEEALCNVGKHAVGATLLKITGQLENTDYRLTIVDNGPGLSLHRKHAGTGTQIAAELEKRLRGKFVLKQNSPVGTFCQLSWPI